MSLASKIRKAEQAKLYTVRGDLSIEDDGRVRLTFTKDAYALVAEDHLDADFMMPLEKGEDPSGRNSKFAVKLVEGAEVELHVDTLVHTFRLAVGEKPFYIDEHELKVIYIDSKAQDCAYKCRKYVVVVDVYCCGNGFTQGGFGSVGCSDMWCDERRCCD